MKPWFCVLMISIPLALAATDKKPTGEIPDRAAFARVRSYCVDTQGMPGDAAYAIEGFLETESKPKKLLTKLPWKLLRDCRQGNPDAVIRIEFPFLNSINIRRGPLPSEPDFYKLKGVMQISDADSARLLYKVQAMPLVSGADESVSSTSQPLPVLRRDVLYGVFLALIHDVERVSPAAKKVN